MAKNSNKYHIYDTVCESFEKELVERYGRVLKHISNFINNRTDALESKNPGMRLLYMPATENDFYDSCGIDRDWMISVIKQSGDLPGEYLVNQPKKQYYHLYILLQVLSCVYYKHEKELVSKYYKGKKEYTPPYIITELYFVIRVYSLQQLIFFKNQPNEQIMQYTIDHLNARFDLATMPNLFSIFQKYAETNNSSLDFDWEHPTDKMMIDYINKMNARIKMFLLSIYREFIKNYNDKKSSGVQELEATNEEGKKFLLVANNISNDVEITSKKILNTFIQDKFINEKFIDIACKNSNNPSKAKVRMIIQKIKNDQDNKLLMEMISCIITYWLVSMKQDSASIHSKQFITTCSAAYTISNTNDPNVIKLKEVLGELITKYANDIIDTEKRSTLISFKKCIHIYMILYIASVN